MNPFRYARPSSPSAALTDFAGEQRARYIAGGTNLLDLMKIAVESPPLLIDINALPLTSIEVSGDAIRVGALARLTDVAENENIRAAFAAGRDRAWRERVAAAAKHGDDRR